MIPHIAHWFFAASTPPSPACEQVTGLNKCDTGLPTPQVDQNTLPHIFALVFGVLAVVAVLMIVIGALRFVTGQGSPQEMSKARNTIIYALVGLLLALTAEAIVAFILGKL